MSSIAAMTDPFAAAAPSSSSNAPARPNNQLTGDSFLTLLTAQLQTQDPLNPVDPTTFVNQLVQFNQLEQLININQTLTADSVAAQSGAAPSTAASSAAQPATASQSAAQNSRAAQI